MSAANYLIGNTGQKLKGKSRGVVKKMHKIHFKRGWNKCVHFSALYI